MEFSCRFYAPAATLLRRHDARLMRHASATHMRQRRFILMPLLRPPPAPSPPPL